MNTRHMTPAELRTIIDSAGIKIDRAAEMAGASAWSMQARMDGFIDISTPISSLLCIHLMFDGLAVELARPWVPDDLAEVLAPTSRA